MTRRVMARIACVAVLALGCFLTALGAIWHWVLHPVYRASEWLGRKEDELNRELWVELKPKTFYILTFYPPSDLVKDWREEKQIRYYDTFCEAVRHMKFYYDSGLATAWRSHPMQIHECTEGQGSKLVASYSRQEYGRGAARAPRLSLHEADGQSVVSDIEDHLHYQFGDPVEDHLSEDELRENEGRRYGKLKNEVDDLKSRSHTGKEKRRGKRKDSWD